VRGMGASEGVDSCVEGANWADLQPNGESFERLLRNWAERRVGAHSDRETASVGWAELGLGVSGRLGSAGVVTNAS
jgi:hypothetical protein